MENMNNLFTEEEKEIIAAYRKADEVATHGTRLMLGLEKPTPREEEPGQQATTPIYYSDFDCNDTMRKLGRLYPVVANSYEGKEIRELLEGTVAKGVRDPLIIADDAYTLGIVRGKQLDRERRRIGKQEQKRRKEEMEKKQEQEHEFINLFLNASPEVQEAVERILTREDTSPEAVRQILIDCNVDPDLIEYWDSMQATA